MSALRTLSELEDTLDEDLAWRRTELHSLLAAVRVEKGPAGACLRRGGMALMYAHWEGYVKNALSSYWKFVARRRLTYKELSLNFVALGIERELRRTQGASETDISISRVARLMDCENDRALMVERDIDTQSNLSSGVLTDLFMKLGLDESSLATRAHFIDFSLLKPRNSIAHGEFLNVSVDAYAEIHHQVLELLDTVRSVVSNAASTQQYLRSLSQFAS
jgi:hypothetical protein